MKKLILVRHGQSQWNLENRFTGWVDVDLSAEGRDEARRAGQLIRDEGLLFDVAHTSLLKRAIRTLWSVLDENDRMWVPVHRSWRLNERHYGALQGLDKAETAARHGEDQVKIWRRSYDVPPPSLRDDDPQHPRRDPRYQNLDLSPWPNGESLKLTVDRFLPYWQKTLAPQLQQGQTVLVVAHGNSLRALIKHLDQISDQDIVELNVPTGIPLLYELDDQLKPLNKRYLGDPEAAARAAASVAQQGQARKN